MYNITYNIVMANIDEENTTLGKQVDKFER
jgi:hypothetical protein